MTSFARNVPLLAACQALMMSGTSLIIATTSLVGFSLAEDKSLSTLPLAIQFMAMMLTTVPAALLLEKIGRRQGFMLATFFGSSGSLLAALAIMEGRFWLFGLGTGLVGIFNGFGIYYRFAAADAVGSEYKSRAVSFIMAGGVVAAFIGPNMAAFTRDLLSTAPFAGSYASLAALYLASLALLAFLDLPQEPAGTGADAAARHRPLRVIAAQPMFIVALVCATIGYGVMALLMTAAPLAMKQCTYSFGSTSFVVQWHVFSMFAPSFATGHLIRRYGVHNILIAGTVLGLLCTAVNLAGESVSHFWLALVLLGVSWNFLFVGATTLLTRTYCPVERAKTQALNDFIVFTCVAAASLSAGALQHYYGWRAVNIGVVPCLVLLLAVVLRGAGKRQDLSCRLHAG